MLLKAMGTKWVIWGHGNYVINTTFMHNFHLLSADKQLTNVY